MNSGPDYQTLFNYTITIIGVLLGWVMKGIRDDQKDAKKATTDLSVKVQAVEVLVAGRYITREEHEKLMQALFNKLDRIENKVDQKVNRDECSGCAKP